MMIGALLAVLVVGSASMAATTIGPDGDDDSVTVSPGDTLTGPVTVQSGGTLILDGGTIDDTVFAEGGSAVEIRRGAINGPDYYWGTDLNVYEKATVTFFGASFEVDEYPYEGNFESHGEPTLTGYTGGRNVAIRGRSESDETLYTVRTYLDNAKVVVYLGTSTTPPPSDPPVAVDDSAFTAANTPVTIDVLGNDTYEGDFVTVSVPTEPSNGTAVVNDDGTVTYTPYADFVGMDTFTYTLADENGESDATVTVNAGSIEIDIKPGDDTNRVNLGSKGVIPVAIFSTEDFDATELDPGNIFLAGSEVRVRGKGNKYLASEEDVNGDGLLDLVVKIETQNLDPDTFQEGGAYLRVHATSDQESSPVLYEGWDSITIVPPAK